MTGNSQVGTRDVTPADELRDDPFGGIDRHGKSDTDAAATRGEMAVLTPMTSALEFSTGPPELPGLIAASVWMMPRIKRPLSARIDRPRELTMPTVRVRSNPNGLPMTKTFWPTSNLEESPAESPSFSTGASILITAKSLLGSAPTGRAGHLLPSASVTSSRRAPSMT